MKERRACDLYLAGKPRTEAYAEAGYWIGKSPKTLKNQASLFFKEPLIAAYVAEQLAAAAARAEINLDRVTREFAAVGFSRATDYLVIGEDGLPRIDLSKLSEEQKAALAEVTVDQLDVVRDGKATKETTRVRFKLHDKLQALTRLREHLGFIPKTALTGADGGPVTMRVVTGFDDD